MTAPLRIGLIGTGYMGQNHLRVLSMLNGARVEFVFDPNVAAAAELAARYGIRASTDPDHDLGHVDAAVICTPTASHADWIRRAARHVKSIFVEKPMTASLVEDRAIAEFVAAGDLHLQVGFIERFNPAVIEFRKIILESKGVIQIDFTRTNRLSSRITDVDVITDLMIHDIDLALHLNGPVKNLIAHGTLTQGRTDFASATLTHANGSFSRILASRITEKKIRLIQATCQEMFIDCDLLRKEIHINKQSSIHPSEESYTISSTEEMVEVRPPEALLTQLLAFIAFCQGKETGPIPSVKEALAAMEICDQIQTQIRSRLS